MEPTVLITGASRGIGKAMARCFANAGYRVAANYNRSRQQAQALQQELQQAGGCCLLVQADVAEFSQVEAMVAQVEREFGQVDVLINNAGVAQQKLFDTVTPEEWRRLFAVNVDGVYHCCKCALPGMLRRHAGVILNVSSMWGIAGASCEVAYSASKAAVIGLTKALAKEVGPSGIRVNCIAPGAVDTEMNAHLSEADLALLREETPLGTLGEAEDVAKLALFLASSAGKFLTGQVISPNGGLVI